MVNTKDIKSNQSLQNNQTFQFKHLHSPSKQLIKKSTKIGVQIRSSMRKVLNSLTMLYLSKETHITIRLMFLTLMISSENQMD